MIYYNFTYALSTKFVYLTSSNKFIYSRLLFYMYYIYHPLLIITAYHNCVYSANTAVSITTLKILARKIASKMYPGEERIFRGIGFAVTGALVSALIQGSPHFSEFSIEAF